MGSFICHADSDSREVGALVGKLSFYKWRIVSFVDSLETDDTTFSIIHILHSNLAIFIKISDRFVVSYDTKRQDAGDF